MADALSVLPAVFLVPAAALRFCCTTAGSCVLVFGTDAGVFLHGLNAKEFGYMVEVGMPPMKALQSATTTNATVLGLADELGQLKEGYLADIVATNEDPIENISTLENVVFVMKEGVVYKN